VAIGTIRRMESFGGEIGSRTSTLSQVQGALEKAGIEFLNDDSPDVRLGPLSAAERRQELTHRQLLTSRRADAGCASVPRLEQVRRRPSKMKIQQRRRKELSF
jgi:hypothetical protein